MRLKEVIPGLAPFCLKRRDAAEYAGMTLEQFERAIESGFMPGPVFDDYEADVFYRKAIDDRLGRIYTDTGYYIEGLH